jgi:TonB-linked SusC/RagA family outer membrane protein
MKKKFNCYGLNKPCSSFQKLFLTLKIASMILICSIMQVSGSIYFQNTQQNMVSGKITDKNTGELLVGVNIVVEGTTIGAISDVSGKYTIQVPNENAVLVFSFIGYVSEKVPVNGQSIIDVNLVSSVRALEEVVVVGYGTQRKKDITGAVSVVTTDALKSIPTGNAVIALQGLASGVNVLGSGVPGGRTDIFIRGVTSFGDTQPLVIVDGVPGSLDNLNMNDIESMQVLKDAGAASIYGVRGSNGVIVVTTKKGSGTPTISYNAYFGVQVPLQGNVFNLLNSKDYARLYKEVDPGTILFANGLPDFTYAGPGVAGTAMAGDPAVDPSKYVFDAANPGNDYLIQKVNQSGTDWFHEVFKPAIEQSHNLNISGGTDKASYLFSLGYLNQQGTLIKTFLKRYSTRMNTQFKIKNNIRIGENAYVFYKQNPGFDNMSEGNAVSMSYLMSPIIPVYDIMGNFGGTWAGPELGANPTNPVANQKRTVNNRDNTWDIIGDVFAEVDFLKHFTARTSFGGTINNQYYYNFNFNQYNEKQGHDGENSYSENALYNSSYIWTNTLNYSNTFGKHSVKILAGSEAINNYGRSVGGGSWNFFSTNFNYLILNNGVSNITNYSTAYSNGLFSLFGRLDYSYNDKYLLGATLRRDGSSVFGAEERYGLFPSFSLGWRISNEGFMKNVTFVNDLKLRGSYGILGSQANVDPSNAYSLYSTGFGTTDYSINGSPNTVQVGFAQATIGNPKTGWEEDVITNVGLDATMLNNKLNVNIEWYKKAINGLLFPLGLPATAGNATPPTVNIGDIQNTGWDFSTTYRSSISDNFRYSVGLNVTTYKNEVVRIPDPGYFDVAGSRMGNMVRNQVGHPVGSFFGYEVIGIFKDDADVAASPVQTDAEPGVFKYRDVNGDRNITPEDRTFFGNPNPDFTYGLNLGINYKSFDFSAIFYGSQGNDVMNWVRNYTDFFGSSQGKGKSNVLLDAWTPQNPDSKIPKAQISSSFSADGVINSYYLEDGSFLKLRSLIFGYSIKPAALQKYAVSEFRIYLQATNLFTLTKYTGLDPELGGSLYGSQSSSSFGIDYGNYPNNQKNFIIGVSVKF